LQAAAADSVAVWPAYWLRNYRDYATALEQLTAGIAQADEHLAP
jgi:iron complex transport system substrate-binding protein